MSNDSAPLTDITRKLRVEQTVRGFLEILDQNELDLEEGLVAWNMRGIHVFFRICILTKVMIKPTNE